MSKQKKYRDYFAETFECELSDEEILAEQQKQLEVKNKYESYKALHSEPIRTERLIVNLTNKERTLVETEKATKENKIKTKRDWSVMKYLAIGLNLGLIGGVIYFVFSQFRYIDNIEMLGNIAVVFFAIINIIALFRTGKESLLSLYLERKKMEQKKKISELNK